MKPHPLLFPLSLIYGVLVSLRNLFFDIGVFRSVDVGVPVISIGNMTAGGTGKTPVVMNAAQIVIDDGKTPAIVSRGYGRESKGTVVVCDGKNILADARTAGDEPLMIARHVKTAIVIVDEDRVRGARTAIDEFGAQVIILDDGFQHRRIARTKDIVLIDADWSPFDTMLLPAGYRRELTGGLKRAQAVLLTKTKSAAAAASMMSDEQFGSVQHKFSSSFQPFGIKHLSGGITQSLDMLKNHSAVAFCGIAHPESFRNSLGSCGVTIKEMFSFPDHHTYTESEMESIITAFHKNNADFILTTEKDAVRLLGFESKLHHLPISALMMEVSIHQKDDWKHYILS